MKICGLMTPIAPTMPQFRCHHSSQRVAQKVRPPSRAPYPPPPAAARRACGPGCYSRRSAVRRSRLGVSGRAADRAATQSSVAAGPPGFLVPSKPVREHAIRRTGLQNWTTCATGDPYATSANRTVWATCAEACGPDRCCPCIPRSFREAGVRPLPGRSPWGADWGAKPSLRVLAMAGASLCEPAYAAAGPAASGAAVHRRGPLLPRLAPAALRSPPHSPW